MAISSSKGNRKFIRQKTNSSSTFRKDGQDTYDSQEMHQNPTPRTYLLRMRVGESISAYIYRLRLTMRCYHLNEGHGYSDYLTPPKKADVLIHTLSNSGPYAEIKNEYSDILKNGRPNYERYTWKGKWYLTLSYLEKRMLDARAKWLNDYRTSDDDEPDYSDNEEIERSPAPPIENPGENENENEEEDPSEDEE